MTAKEDAELAGILGEYYADPLGYVMFSFPWDTYAPIQLVELEEPYASRFGCKYGPDAWACEFLDSVAEEVKERNFDGHSAVDPIQMATASGHGIGKSVLVAWLIKWIMDTRPFSKGTVTANTAEQLKTKTWAELGKWHKISATEHWFTYNSGRGAMNLAHKKHKEEWRCDAQTCREENSEAFAGQHAASATSFYIFDEASAVPDKIFEVREGGTTDGEPMVFDFGNPTRNSGRFFEQCAGRFRHRYKVRNIDSRSVAITNKTRIQAWIEDYGEESDFVKVRVRGMFPSAGSLQFIPSDMVDEAMQRETIEDSHAPLLIGVDVARFGDNESVIFPRIGYDARSWPARRYQGLDTVQLTGKVIECVREFKSRGVPCSGLFVDGGGVGGGVVDQLRSLGYAPIEVQFGGKAVNGKTYRYRSDEMWGNMKDAMPKLCLPMRNETNALDLKSDLTQREFGYTLQGNKVHLEPKKDMVARGVASPDLADALALTFAQEVSPMIRADQIAHTMTIHEYDPLEAA
mgnify:CR=1 FL=1|tara:strand:+ start:1437 stop:2990 length:1554 start_codon:yes stop_codon:yes gene_type:complete